MSGWIFDLVKGLQTDRAAVSRPGGPVARAKRKSPEIVGSQGFLLVDDTGLEVGERWFFKCYHDSCCQIQYEIRTIFAHFMTAHPVTIQTLKGKNKGKL